MFVVQTEFILNYINYTQCIIHREIISVHHITLVCTLAGDAYCNYFGSRTMKAIALAAKNFKKGALDTDDDEYYSRLEEGGLDGSRKVRGVVRMQRCNFVCNNFVCTQRAYVNFGSLRSSS